MLSKTLQSEDGRFKAVIDQRHDGAYQVTVWKWTREQVPDYGEVCEPFWSQIDRGVTLTDTLERAEALAKEQLSALGATVRGDSEESQR